MSTDLPIRRPDRNRPEPLWHQTEQSLRDMIQRGEWQDGDQLPNETRLTEMLGVSRITLRHALRRLEESGHLRREHGRGTFVRRSTIVAGIRGLTSFTEEMAYLGDKVGTRGTSAVEMPAEDDIAEALALKPGEPVIKLRRVRLANGNPIGVQTAYLPAHRVPGFLPLKGELTSLYDFLREGWGIAPQSAEELYRAGTVSAEDAADLAVAPGSPAFEVRRTTSDAHGPFEHVESTMRADRYEIRSKLFY
ncbi:GntR family transcriptional regulator [Maritimibacter fusiformis]|uniref:GntR family transcriptional regulator n=1 Tax=Maritimibacter fusiformis TaxID=2603819 RepID=A0A5D0RPS0_9RHOB|nr:GntR family transcriptional regulator [Maritimibacter fusiformis]TYB83513.1 GntR family transcriptional regulator [Maritimibacter fusiformis]